MPGGMLTTWMENVKRAGVKNAMVVALDAQTKTNAEAQGIVAHEMHLEVSTLSDNPLCARSNGSNSSTSTGSRQQFNVDAAASCLAQSAVQTQDLYVSVELLSTWPSNALQLLVKSACYCHNLMTVLMLTTYSHKASATQSQITASPTPGSGRPLWPCFPNLLAGVLFFSTGLFQRTL